MQLCDTISIPEGRRFINNINVLTIKCFFFEKLFPSFLTRFDVTVHYCHSDICFAYQGTVWILNDLDPLIHKTQERVADSLLSSE